MRVDIGDTRLFFEVFGAESIVERGVLRSRPTIVCLHGGPGLDGTKMRHYAAPLASVAQVVVPDQRGHGRSDRGSEGEWNLFQWGADVVGLCAALEIEGPIVMGTSFGGFVAQRYASDHPDHPGGLILASCGPRLTGEDELVERFRAVGGDEAAAVTKRDVEEPSAESAAEWERVCGPLLSLRSDPEHDELEALRVRTPEITLHFLRGEAWEMDLRAGLRSVRCPTLVLVGEHDPLIPVELAEEIVDAIPDGLARLMQVPDAAHEIFVDNPDITFGAIRDFIAESASACRMGNSRRAKE